MNIILDADSYKNSHFAMYPEGTNAMSSYVQARKKNEQIVPFGLQGWIKENLLKPITKQDIDEAETILVSHGLSFNRAMWEKVLTVYGGYLPVTIFAVPEGKVVDSSNPLVTVECYDADCFSIASFIETSMQRAIWYPTTIASQDLYSYNQIQAVYKRDSDATDMIPFSLHSFGSRGVSSRQTAEVGGAAHLIYFKGTDDVVALKYLRDNYNADMPGYSVLASEHSVQCSYGKEGQREYLKRMISLLRPGNIVSAVMDGYDIYREVDVLCEPEFVEAIKNSGGKFVVRPDSGDPFVVLPRILEKLKLAFGFTVNSKGKIVINNVGVLQGDGINRTTMPMLLRAISAYNYAPENVIYGSGGGLLQNVNRDTYSFAQKTSAIRVGDTWIDTVKDPITDSGKKSVGGRQITSLMRKVYDNGDLLVNESFSTIVERANKF
jgi:nicotinamide phosphoribosyltransferase